MGANATLKDLAIESPMDNAHIIVVALDGEPIATSKRMLLQAMSEEQASGFATEDAGNGMKRITNIGRYPWRVKSLSGTVLFRSASGLAIQPLDLNGYTKGAASHAAELALAPDTVYYLVSRKSVQQTK